jgi:hypothetical protein
MSDNAMTDPLSADLRYFRTCITVMAVILVSGFVFQLSMGRSSFSAPLVVHVHAFVFMGWVAITVTQAWLAAAGNRQWHRTLGAVGLAWVCAVAVLGPLVTIEAVRTARVPFFFQPQHFLLVNPISLLAFLGVFAAALTFRRHPDWHARLQVGGFAMLMGPGIGRLIPMPLLTPWAFEVATVIPLIVPVIGMVRDQRRTGRVHPAWAWPIGLMLAALVAARLIAFSPIGDAIYSTAAAGSVAEGTDGRAFPPPPPAP